MDLQIGNIFESEKLCKKHGLYGAKFLCVGVEHISARDGMGGMDQGSPASTILRYRLAINGSLSGQTHMLEWSGWHPKDKQFEPDAIVGQAEWKLPELT